jgi:DNA polymerase/3'-5' exonuclease PolX
VSSGGSLSSEYAIRVAHAAVRLWLNDGAWSNGQRGIYIVGSLRRDRQTVGDIDLIAPLPRVEEGTADERNDSLFAAVNASASNPWQSPRESLFVRDEQSQVSQPILTIESGLKPGFKAAKLHLHIGAKTRLPCQIFRYTDQNFGWVAIYRTGPSNFGVWFLAQWKKRYSIPLATAGKQASKDGYLVDARCEVVPVATEEDAFRLAGIDYIPPHQREAFMDSVDRSRKQRWKEQMR